jgi:hypothetical protein
MKRARDFSQYQRPQLTTKKAFLHSSHHIKTTYLRITLQSLDAIRYSSRLNSIALFKKSSFPTYSRSTSNFRRFFFPWMCFRVFFSSVNFHLFNHSESLATDITRSCSFFMLPACQVVRQAHQIDSKAPHCLDLSPVTSSLHSM